MKETIKINLNGQLFDLDRDAYERLKIYLNSLEKKFGKESDTSKEILEDIEARIAELLNTKLDDKKQVVSVTDIEEIIGKLGTADEMGETEEENREKQTNHPEYSGQPRKRMYRDVDHSVIAGVCSGLGNYFNIDPIWVRLIFIGLFFLQLSGVLIYLILWIVIPAAKTTAQKLEMEGKAVNIDNIYESVNKEFGKVKSGVKNYSQSQEFRNAESALGEFLKRLGEVLLVFVKIIGAIVGVSLVIALILVILSLIFGWFSISSLGIVDHWHWTGMWNWQSMSLFVICIILVIFIPVIAIIIKLVRWIFGLPGQNQIISVISATIWVIALITIIYLLATEHNKGLFRNNTKTSHAINPLQNKTLYVDLNSSGFYTNHMDHYQIFDLDFFWDEDDDEFLNEPELSIQKSSDNSYHLEVQKEYYHFEVGKVPGDFDEIARYNWRQSDTLLLLDKFYTSDEEEFCRVPYVKLILYVPESKTIQISHDVAEILEETEFKGESSHDIIADQKLKMTPQGLEILK